ncbi:MAG: hypothetical protein OEZ65_05690 [Gemmatimonadota bacterium]|nr:hypothetical protein [Gemmatimonadota bacterium]
MRRLLARLRALGTELQRRRVHRVAGLYAVTLFVILQLADVTFEPLGISSLWLAVLVVAGTSAFPVALILAWIFDITEDGLRQAAPGSIADTLGRTPARRVVTVLGVATVSVVSGWGAWQVTSPGGSMVPGTPMVDAAIPDLDPRRIAVLYLDDHSEDGSLGHLAAELTEGLLHELGTVDGLQVASRNAVKPYRYNAVSLDSIVRVLRAGSLVEGSVTRAGDRVRATVQLIDGATLSHLGSHVVEGSLADPFAFQDSLTFYVARTLRQRLGREIRVRSARAGTDDAEAWTAFARGRDELDEYERYRDGDKEAAHEALLRADSLFRLALDRDPDWESPLLQRAVALGRLAALHGPLPGALDPERAARADSILAEALERNPGSESALAFRGWLRARLARTPGVPDAPELIAGAEEDLRAALSIDSNIANAWWTLSEVLVRQARFLEAVEAAEHALDADAFLEVEEQALFSLQYSISQLGPRDDAIRLCDEGRRRFPLNTNFVACRFVILGSYPQAQPDVAHARALLDSLVAASPAGDRETWRTYGTVWLARVLARSGDADGARAMLDQVREPGRTPPALAYDEAHVQLLLGDREEAVRLLASYLTIDPDTAFIRKDWWFEGLRDFEPFQDLVGPGRKNDGGEA